MRALFAHIGRSHVTLYRGLVFDDRPKLPRNQSFVSASFDFEVAKSCFVPRELSRNGLLTRQVVPIAIHDNSAARPAYEDTAKSDFLLLKNDQIKRKKLLDLRES